MCAADLAAKEKEIVQAEALAVQARDRYQNACAGVVGGEDSAALLSLPEQVGAWERRAREAESQLESGKLKTKHAAAQMKELAKQSAKQQARHVDGVKEVEALRLKVNGLEEQLRAVGGGGGEDLGARIGAMRGAAKLQQDKMEKLKATVSARVNVDFKDPEKGFDRSRVKGVLAQLVNVQDPTYAGALETVAGGRLYNLVVDTAETANLIIERGQVKKRITCLPLDKLVAEPMRATRVVAAKALAAQAGGSCFLALELVSYDAAMERAVVFAFGNTLVCSSAEVAKAVAFHPDVRAKVRPTLTPTLTVTVTQPLHLGP